MAPSSSASPLSNATESVFEFLDTVFRPVQKVKRHLRNGTLVQQGRDARGRRKRIAARRERRQLADMEAASVAPRKLGKETVHLMPGDPESDDAKEPLIAKSTEEAEQLGGDDGQVAEEAGARGNLDDAAENREDQAAESEDDSLDRPVEDGGVPDNLVKAHSHSRALGASREELPRKMTHLGEDLELMIASCQIEMHDAKFPIGSDEWGDMLLQQRDHIKQVARRKRKKEMGGLSVDEVVQVFVKESLLHSKSEFDLLQRCELLIDEDWADNVDELPGSIYRMAAFGEFNRLAAGGAVDRTMDADNLLDGDTDIKEVVETAARCQDKFEGLVRAWIRLAGMVCIVLIQLCGPPLVCFSMVPGDYAIGVTDDQKFTWERATFFTDNAAWQKMIIEEWSTFHLTKLLGVVVLAAFVWNGAYVLYKEVAGFKKIYGIFQHLNENTPQFNPVGGGWLIFGALINCWVVLWCSLDAFLIIGSGITPKEKLLDGLALIFLYNLDDIGGDFNFVDSDDWPGNRLGWIYDNMVEGENKYELRRNEERETAQSMVSCCNRLMYNMSVKVYSATIGLTLIMGLVLPVAACLTPFSVIAPDNNSDN